MLDDRRLPIDVLSLGFLVSPVDMSRYGAIWRVLHSGMQVVVNNLFLRISTRQHYYTVNLHASCCSRKAKKRWRGRIILNSD